MNYLRVYGSLESRDAYADMPIAPRVGSQRTYRLERSVRPHRRS
ncbi:hypothetical protein [Posidoniimonas corsicana]|nr:hypothetical protein [Posidoniimonas corsicana]